KTDGYRRAMEELLPSAEQFVQTTLFTVEGGAAAGRKLFEHGVTAVVCGSDMMALGVVRAARQAGLRVPEDVSVIGSDDSQLIGLTDPPLTTVRQDVESMSEAAVTAILEEIQGEEVVHREYLFAPELILRRSTGKVPTAP